MSGKSKKGEHVTCKCGAVTFVREGATVYCRKCGSKL